MYDKRSLGAWPPLRRRTAVWPTCGGGHDRMPTAKQRAVDQLSATRGAGLRAERVELTDQKRWPSPGEPSSATDLEHSFSGLAKFFLPGKPALVALEAEPSRGSACATSSMTSTCRAWAAPRAHHRKGPLRGRPAAAGRTRGPGLPSLRRLHGHVARGGGRRGHRPVGAPLSVPLDNVSPVAWVGYANETLAARIGPVLAELVDGLGAG